VLRTLAARGVSGVDSDGRERAERKRGPHPKECFSPLAGIMGVCVAGRVGKIIVYLFCTRLPAAGTYIYILWQHSKNIKQTYLGPRF
jgi:hypothetical protein